eukprot:5266263-Prymnesium_polylepis.1
MEFIHFSRMGSKEHAKYSIFPQFCGQVLEPDRVSQPDLSSLAGTLRRTQRRVVGRATTRLGVQLRVYRASQSLTYEAAGFK